MAVTQENLLVSIEANTGNATKALGEVATSIVKLAGSVEELSKAQGEMQKDLEDTGAEALKLNEIIELGKKGFEFLSEAMEKTVGSYQESQDNIKHLSASLALLGEKDIKRTVEGFNKFGEEMQSATVFTKDQTIALLDMAKGFGLSNEKAEKMVKAAADLSAFKKIPLEDAFRALSSSLGGTSHGIGALLPQIKGMSEETLKAGGAVDYVSKNMDGFAASTANTFAGTMKRLKNEVADIFQSIGETIAVGFNLDQPNTGLLELVKNIKEDLASVQPTLIAFAQNTLLAFSKAGAAIEIPFQAAEKSALGAVVYVTDKLKAFSNFIQQLTGKQILPTAQFDEFTKRIKAGQDEIVKSAGDNLNILKKSWVTVADAEAKLAASRDKATETTIKGGQVFQSVMKENKKAAEELKKALDELAKIFENIEIMRGRADTDEVGKIAIEYGKQAEALGKQWEILKKLGKESQYRAQIEEHFKMIQEAELAQFAKMGKDAFEEQNAALTELNDKLAAAYTGPIGKLQATAQKEIEILEIKKKQLEAHREIYGPAIITIEAEMAAIMERAQKESKDLADKNLKEQLAGIAEISAALATQNMTTRERIAYELSAQVAVLDAKRKELELDREANSEAIAALDARKKALEAQAADKASKAPSQEYDKLVQAGQKTAGTISGVLTQGMTSWVGGAVSMVGTIVDAIGALLDFIPQIVDKIAGIFDKAANLPNELLKVFKHLGQSVLDFTNRFLPELLDNLPKIFEDLIDKFLNDIPKAGEKLIQKLPALVTNFANKIPEIVKKFIAGIIQDLPITVKSLIEAIIKLLPVLVREYFKLIWTFIPMVIKAIWDGIKGAISGGGSDMWKPIEEAPAKFAKGIADGWKKITQNASAIFQVSDLTKGAKNPFEQAKIEADKTLEKIDAAKSAFEKMFQHWIDVLVETWRKIWLGFQKYVIDPLVNAWHDVWDLFQKKLLDPLTKLWRDVWDGIDKNLIQPLKDVTASLVASGKKIWDGFVSGVKDIGDYFKKLGGKIWDGLVGSVKDIAQYFKNLGGDIWNAFSDLAKGKFKDFGTDIWNAFKDALDFKQFEKAGGKIWDSFVGALDWTYFERAGSHIWNALLDGLSSFDWSSLTKAITGGGGGSNGGYLGKITGGLLAEGGIVAGTAMVAGDSTLNDKVLSLLSPGEGVIPRSLMAKPEIKALFDSIMKGHSVPRLAYGGAVPAMALAGGLLTGAATAAAAPKQQTIHQEFEFHIKVDGAGGDVDAFIRKFMPKIKDALRRDSLNNRTTVYAGGVRTS